MGNRAFRGLLLVAVLAVGLGCKEQLTPLALNTHAAAGNRKIAKAATDLRQQLLQLQMGKNVPPAQIRSSYENLRRTVAEVRADTNRVGPDFVPEASDFYNTYQGFLNGQENLLNDEFPKIMKVVEGEGSPVQKWNAIRPILDSIDKVEGTDLSRLLNAQKGLAEGGNFLAPGQR
jgi:hypothetical protein